MKEDNTSFIQDDFRGLGLFIFNKRLNNDSDNVAVYGQATFRPVEQLGITLGGRWTREKKTVDVRQTAIIPGLGVVPLYNTADVARLGTPTAPIFEDFTPKISIDYRIQPDVSVYASYTEGFKSGGWNGRALSAAEFVDVKAESVKSYEVGLKSELFDRRLRFNADYFYADYSDFIVTAVSPITGGFITINAAQAVIQGFEAEANARLAPGLDVFASVGRMYNRYDALAPSVPFPKTNEIKRTPEWTGQVGFSYERPLSEAYALKLDGTYSYQDPYFNGVSNTRVERAPRQSILNGSVALVDDQRGLTYTLACRNCTDDRYFHSTLDFSALGFAVQFPGEPRTYYAAIKYEFGGNPPPPRAAPGLRLSRPRLRRPLRRRLRWPMRRGSSWSTSPSTSMCSRPKAQQVIAQAADYAKGGNATRVVVVGHTDTSGSAAYNVRLSERRAKAAADALVGSGLNQSALAVDWKGESRARGGHRRRGQGTAEPQGHHQHQLLSADRLAPSGRQGALLPRKRGRLRLPCTPGSDCRSARGQAPSAGELS